MVKLTIKEAAEARGVTTAYQLQKLMGFQPAMAARLWKGDMKLIGLSTLDTICEKLDCDLSEIISRENKKPKLAKKALKGGNQ